MRSLTAVLLLLALAPAVQAQTLPPAGLTVGGGGFYGKKNGVGSRLVTMRVESDGRTISLAGQVFANCDGPAGLRRFFAGTATLNDDGTFSAQLPTTWPGANFFRGSGDAVITGRFDGVRASGTIGYAPGATLKGNRRRRDCSADTGGFEARDPGRPSGSATDLVPGQMLYGLTSDRRAGLPMAAVVEVGKKGRRLRTVTGGIAIRCPYEPRAFVNYSPRIAVDAAGAFRLRERFPFIYNDAVSRYRITTSGHLAAGGGIVGRIAVAIKARVKKGPQKGRVDRCPRAGSASYAVVP